MGAWLVVPAHAGTQCGAVGYRECVAYTKPMIRSCHAGEPRCWGPAFTGTTVSLMTLPVAGKSARP